MHTPPDSNKDTKLILHKQDVLPVGGGEVVVSVCYMSLHMLPSVALLN